MSFLSLFGREPDCALCNDTGQVDCFMCAGRRRQTQPCGGCEGAQKQRCDWCEGQGFAAGTICQGCDGTGLRDCQICSGHGWVFCVYCAGYGKVQCPAEPASEDWEELAYLPPPEDGEQFDGYPPWS